MAASWGCFDLQRQEFLYEALKHAGVDTSYLPEVRKGHFLIGKTRDGVPVMGSIGDNQASLFGSVRDLEDTVLLNVGTGSQISFVSEEFVECGGSVELRPCTESSYILVGASFLEKYGKEAVWKVDTAFSGTRSDPSRRGMITGIGVWSGTLCGESINKITGNLECILSMKMKCTVTSR